MSELELFDSKGKFVFPTEQQIAELDDGTRERWAAVRDAALDHDEINAAIKASEQRVIALMKEATELEQYIRTTFPGQAREQAVRDFLATERIKRRV